MKLAIFAVVALASVALAGKENLFEKPGHKYNHAERLGVFGVAPFVDLYKTYAYNFVVPSISPAPSHDDTRYYRPSVDICRSFLTNFVNQDYKITDFDQFVVLDACLGYVLDDHYKREQEAPEWFKVKVRDSDVENFDSLKEVKELTDLYATKMREFSDAERTCVADLLMRSIKAKEQFKGVVCNNHMLQVYLQFAECQAQPGFTNLTPENTQDPYVKLIYELLRERVNTCFKVELAHIENAVREQFSKSKYVLAFGSKLPTSIKSIRKQQLKNYWPKEIVNVLSVVQATKKEINLRQVHQILSAFVRNDDKMKNIFLNHLAAYATEKINPQRKAVVKASDPAANDRYGLTRYTEAMDQLCNPFRISTSERHYSYALSLLRLVELLQHQNLFDIDEDEFVENLIKRTEEVGPIYMATYACNLITYTQGTYETTDRKPEYKVSFKPDITKMVVWPMGTNL